MFSHISSANYKISYSGKRVFTSLTFLVLELCTITLCARIQLPIESNIKWRLYSLVERSRANDDSALRFCLHFVFVFKSSGSKTLISVKCLGTPPASHTPLCGLAQYPYLWHGVNGRRVSPPHLCTDLTFRDTQLSTSTFIKLFWHLHLLTAMCTFVLSWNQPINNNFIWGGERYRPVIAQILSCDSFHPYQF